MKDSDLKLAQEGLREADFTLQRTRMKEEVARKLAHDLLSELDEERTASQRKDRLQDDMEWALAGYKEASNWS